jgi:GNAT superfamily N-acetyltransferase
MDAAREFTLREFRSSDIPALVAIGNKIYPDTPITVEQEEHNERSYPADNPRLRFVAEAANGQVVGQGHCSYPFWMRDQGVYQIWAGVDPAWHGRGIGRALFAALEPFGWQRGATRLWTDCREDSAATIRFLEAAGYHSFGLRYQQALDLTTFHPERFKNALDRVVEEGYILTTYAEERKLRPDAERALYDLQQTVMADVPLPGGAVDEIPYEEWRSYMVDNPAIDYAFVFLAKQGDQLVGLTAVNVPKVGPAHTSDTGVFREHRGRGVAMALKVMSLQALKARSYIETRTHNDTVNPPILHLNEKLGYRRLPGWLQYEKPAPM